MNRAEQKAETREKILDLAADRLRREGLANTAWMTPHHPFRTLLAENVL